jgi:hypothetical protein
MYWCRSNISFIFSGGIMLAMCLLGCKPGIKEKPKYFDISDYFKKDSIRLTKENKTVFKTVSHNGVSESKKVHIANWGLEFSLFKAADINKPAWKDSYTVIDEDGTLIYRAKYPELKVREMLIKKEKGKVKWILIYNKTKTMIYQSTEKLSYYPDSLYLIEKDQRVRLMGNNHYSIQGVIGK